MKHCIRVVILTAFLFSTIYCSLTDAVSDGISPKKKADNKNLLFAFVLLNGSVTRSGLGCMSGGNPSSSSYSYGTCAWVTASGIATCMYDYIEGACADLPKSSYGGTSTWYQDTTSSTCRCLGYANCSSYCEYGDCMYYCQKNAAYNDTLSAKGFSEYLENTLRVKSNFIDTETSKESGKYFHRQ